VRRRLLLSAALATFRAGAAHAQPATDVAIPPVQIATAFSYDVQREGTPDLRGGPGALVAVDGNINQHVAVVTELAASPRMRTAMVGARLSTGFYRDGPGGPGRFFAEVLGGRRTGGVAGDGAAVQLGAGSDVLIVPRGVSLHLGLDYLFTPGARRDFAGARVSIGVVAGPHER
jgi:hypothetical protein